MKQLLLLLTIANSHWASFINFQDDFVNPTGTYRSLKGILLNHKIAGHSGELRVKFLGKGQVAFFLSLFPTAIRVMHRHLSQIPLRRIPG